MKTVSTQERQTLFDIALQFCGDANAAFEIAEENDVSLSAVLTAGTVLNVPEPADAPAKKTVEYYALNSVSPATDDSSVPNNIAITSISGIELVTINSNELITIII
jgi:hypothetical protein